MAGHDQSDSVTTTALLAALSHALDLTEGHPRGHAERTCAIGLALAERLHAPALAGDLVHAALLKDAGCSSNAARVYELFGGPEHGVKRAVWERDWRNPVARATYAAGWVERGGSAAARLKRLIGLAAAGSRASRELFQIRCARGAEIASHLGFPRPVTSAIHDMDEHWDGGGHPRGLAGDAIPLLARLIGAAQVMEIFWGLGGPSAARAVLATRAGRWFDPEIARAGASLDDRHAVWRLLQSPDLTETLLAQVPIENALRCTPERVDRIAEAVALIIDGKSPFTRSHSDGVARRAVELGRRLGSDAAFLTRLRRAALVHDVGKLTVPNSILDAPRPLTPPEWQVVRQHVAFTYSILQRMPVLAELAFDAASHHERLDGNGYCRGLRGDAISLTARILAVADVADALAAHRPYRRGMAPDEVLQILRESAGTHLCPACVDACSVDVVEDTAAA